MHVSFLLCLFSVSLQACGLAGYELEISKLWAICNQTWCRGQLNVCNLGYHTHRFTFFLQGWYKVLAFGNAAVHQEFSHARTSIRNLHCPAHAVDDANCQYHITSHNRLDGMTENDWHITIAGHETDAFSNRSKSRPNRLLILQTFAASELVSCLISCFTSVIFSAAG